RKPQTSTRKGEISWDENGSIYYEDGSLLYDAMQKKVYSNANLTDKSSLARNEQKPTKTKQNIVKATGRMYRKDGSLLYDALRKEVHSDVPANLTDKSSLARKPQTSTKMVEILLDENGSIYYEDGSLLYDAMQKKVYGNANLTDKSSPARSDEEQIKAKL